VDVPVIALALLLAAVAPAQTSATKPEPPAPQITAEQRSMFWRAQYEYATAVLAAQKAKAALDAAQEQLIKACGGQPVIAGINGEPACKPSPKIKEP
jgi:multidrug efflux pump subunit AcrA (membrane-fusion protein)